MPQPRYLNARAVSMTARGAHDPRGGYERRVGYGRDVSPMRFQYERSSSTMRNSSSHRSKMKIVDDPDNVSEPDSDLEANAPLNKGDLAELANLRRTFVGQTMERRIIAPPRPPPANGGEHFKRLGRIAGTNRRVLKQHVRNYPMPGMEELDDAAGLYPDPAALAARVTAFGAVLLDEQPSANTGVGNPGSSTEAAPIAQIRTPRRVKLPALERTLPALETEGQDSIQCTSASPKNKASSGGEVERADIMTSKEDLDGERPRALPPMDMQPPLAVVNLGDVILEIAPPIPETPRRPYRRRLTPILRSGGTA